MTRRPARHAQAERSGRRGEIWAALYLQLQGWRIVGRRVRTPRGEIDLIARRGHIVNFIEVKYRRTARQRDEAIDFYRLKRVAAAVEAIAHLYCRNGETVRIDVVMLARWRWPRHITNAWQP
ncbi:YraN family protein [Altericroceibacterium spongiae]|uniref:UPF0102 protein D6851_03270 n=1 Tax=Altericroceibacterium spongiae TaxID=2320269 RepID=A0A420ES39_9SPHN|nr:YraN family protein [Altericroceibacterium spongiae]RKF23495.1 YraN family protein [Altericroceibacterium spongiae]